VIGYTLFLQLILHCMLAVKGGKQIELLGFPNDICMPHNSSYYRGEIGLLAQAVRNFGAPHNIFFAQSVYCTRSIISTMQLENTLQPSPLLIKKNPLGSPLGTLDLTTTRNMVRSGGASLNSGLVVSVLEAWTETGGPRSNQCAHFESINIFEPWIRLNLGDTDAKKHVGCKA